MVNYVHFENGVLVGKYDALPTAWKNISGFNNFANDVDFLASYGWYKVVRQNQEYDSSIYKHEGFDYSIQNNVAIETPVLVEYTQEELNNQLIQQREYFLNNLRIQRNRKLIESDWTQTVDVNESMSNDTRLLWKQYRQALRDLPSQYINLQNYRGVVINWPLPPQ